MQVFIDKIGRDGLYRKMDKPSWLSPELPLEVFTMSGLADGSIDLAFGGGCLIYHVERSTYLSAVCFADTAVSEIDTLVVVTACGGTFLPTHRIDQLWHRAGGVERRLANSGMSSIERPKLLAFVH